MTYLNDIPVRCCLPCVANYRIPLSWRKTLFRSYHPQHNAPSQPVRSHRLQQFHVETNHDYFMSKPTIPWFEALVWLELLFQVPFFAFATAGFVRRWNAVRIPCIIYGTSAATSVVPIVADVLASEKLTDPQRYKLVGICEPRSGRGAVRRYSRSALFCYV